VFNNTKKGIISGPNGRVCQCQSSICRCVPDMAFLEGVYVQNLQTQIEVLELENAYL
jgi:hypothetical protein